MTDNRNNIFDIDSWLTGALEEEEARIAYHLGAREAYLKVGLALREQHEKQTLGSVGDGNADCNSEKRKMDIREPNSKRIDFSKFDFDPFGASPVFFIGKDGAVGVYEDSGSKD